MTYDNPHLNSGLRGHLDGHPVTVLEAPPEASSRFTYYFDEKAYEWNLLAPPPVNRRLTAVWNPALEQRLQTPDVPKVGATGTGTSTGAMATNVASADGGRHLKSTCYMQLGVATRRGGTRDTGVMGGSGPPALAA